MTDLIIDTLGHLGYLSGAIGTFFVSVKNKDGFLLRMACDSIWLAIGFYLDLSSIVIWSIIFLWVDYKAYRRWDSHEQRP